MGAVGRPMGRRGGGLGPWGNLRMQSVNAGRGVPGLLADGFKLKLGGGTPLLEGPCPVSSIC